MGWIRLDDRFAEHEKVLELTDREFRVHIAALCFTARAQKARITRGAFALLGATSKIAGRLVEVGLWDVDGDGWAIHDWDDYQRRETADPMTNAERQALHRRRKRNEVSNADVTPPVTHRNEGSNANV